MVRAVCAARAVGQLVVVVESASFPPKTTTFSWIFRIFKDILGYFAGFLGFSGLEDATSLAGT